MNASEIISVLKSEIADFDRKTGVQEGGTVVRVGDGIATVYGMQHAMYGELVEFETGVRGIIQNLEEKTVGVVLLGSDYGIVEGTQVMRTKKRAGVGVGSGLIGRVVDALGAPIDGGAPIEPEDYYPIEREAAGVADRKSVSVPLQTGILSIDSMFPIGRGQRELIIGDRQTGNFDCCRYHHQPEGTGCHLYLCCHRSEVLNGCKNCKYSENPWCNGLFRSCFRIRQCSGSSAVYCTVFRYGDGRILHASGQRRSDYL